MPRPWRCGAQLGTTAHLVNNLGHVCIGLEELAWVTGTGLEDALSEIFSGQRTVDFETTRHASVRPCPRESCGSATLRHTSRGVILRAGRCRGLKRLDADWQRGHNGLRGLAASRLFTSSCPSGCCLLLFDLRCAPCAGVSGLSCWRDGCTEIGLYTFNDQRWRQRFARISIEETSGQVATTAFDVKSDVSVQRAVLRRSDILSHVWHLWELSLQSYSSSPWLPFSVTLPGPPSAAHSSTSASSSLASLSWRAC